MLSTPQLIILSLIVGVIVVNVFFTLWFIRYRTRIVKCRILKEYGESWEVIKEKKIKLNESSFDYKDKSYIIDPQKIMFTVRKGLELFYKEDESEPITFVGTKKPKDAKVFGKMLKSEMVAKLIAGYKDKYYILVIVCLILVVLGISTYSLWTFNNLSNELLEMNKLLYNQTKGVIIG